MTDRQVGEALLRVAAASCQADVEASCPEDAAVSSREVEGVHREDAEEEELP